MSAAPLPAWLLPVWRDIMSRRARLPHALLLCGPAGSGKRQFAEQLAQALLCASPTDEGFACGVCPDCAWFATQNHPDVLRLVPEAEQDDGAEEGEAAEPAARKEKARSTQILIDQVRAVQGALEVGSGGHAGGRRIVIVDPAEAMNVAAANALLKSLEEPNGSAVFLMLSNTPRRLLPTIRSRCQTIAFAPPGPADTTAWAHHTGIDNAAAMLGFCSGLPLLAERMASKGLLAVRRQLAEDLSQLPRTDPLKLAAQWEARLKAKDAVEQGFDLPGLVSWIQRWLADGVRISQGLQARFYADYAHEIKQLSQGRSALWLACYREFGGYRKIAAHPLNLRLMLEELMLVLHRRTTVGRK